jgi:hypothetical protein
VEALWRRDRVRFWILVPCLALSVAVYLLYVRPVELSGSLSNTWVATGIAVVLWVPSVVFTLLGMLSVWRLWVALSDPAKNGGERLLGLVREEWVRASLQGSVGWWSLVMVLLVAVAMAASGWTLGRQKTL